MLVSHDNKTMLKKENAAKTSNSYDEGEINLLEYARAILIRKRLVFVFILISIICACLAGYIEQRFHKASAVIQLAYLGEPLMSDTVALQELQKESLLVNAIETTGVSIKPETLKKMMRIEYIPKTNRVNITIEHTDSQVAIMLAKAITQIFISTHSDSYQKELLLKKNYIASLQVEVAFVRDRLVKINNILGLKKKSRVVIKEFNYLQSIGLRYTDLYNELTSKLFLSNEKLSVTNDYEIFDPVHFKKQKLYKNVVGELGNYVPTGLILAFITVFWQEFGMGCRRS